MKYNYFNFRRFGDQYLITNDLGRYSFVSEEELKSLISKRIDVETPLGQKLMNAGFIYNDHPLEYVSRHEWEARNSKGFLFNGTSLHIFVITTACDLNCVYCQANSGNEKSPLFMNEEIARKAVDIALQSPERNLSFEFQGGEPLLNYPIMKTIIEYAENQNTEHNIQFSVVTNLTHITEEILDYFKRHNVSISTSLDGPEFVHNCNRTFINGGGSYDSVSEGISKVQKSELHVGAIQTTTRQSLGFADQIVNTYAELGLDSIFIRPLTPLGKASKNWESVGYTTDEFLAFYEKALKSAIELNLNGVYFREEQAAIFLRRILGQNINYMELRSPCGAGTGQLAYYADGSIFTCDEARMLSEMGDDSFLLGNVWNNDYRSLIKTNVCKTACISSILEALPSCIDCVYQPYCGVCPVVQYALTGDVIEKEPEGYRCRIYKGILDLLFSFLREGNPDERRVLESWCN